MIVVSDTSSTDDSAFSSRPHGVYSASVPKHIMNIRGRRSMNLDEDSDEDYVPVSKNEVHRECGN